MEERDAKHAEVIKEKQDLFHQDKVTESTLKKWKTNCSNYVKQKLLSVLSCQDRCCSSVDNYFICSSSCPAFDIFRDDTFIQMLKTVSSIKNNEVKMLIIPLLNKCSHAEWDVFFKNTYNKSSQIIVLRKKQSIFSIHK